MVVVVLIFYLFGVFLFSFESGLAVTVQGDDEAVTVFLGLGNLEKGMNDQQQRGDCNDVYEWGLFVYTTTVYVSIGFWAG